ncbi:endonuclease/exonuclease/phosphatase family protein [Maridesulfovibrio hydrothermalis]|uniref:Endonuclease/exonuclease/phosphatase n=1 Tax=Maridesulfovibrio hydrothermalis AM13 = DSM 14728 TaxID=1121451 RepID=L0RAI4_9BACT|nr:endonuclease/exonuclease/phosphatase family protein [Maridesulfovibrio hydrothermalis]CCO23788.1 Endonuclease/exonuclease/phosphatase [Maridesulfovibrio hydrothermalis AM13 = DSM 14728]
MKMLYTFLKFISPVLFFCLISGLGWFIFKWYSEPEYKVGSVKKGEVLNFNSNHTAEVRENKIRILSYNFGFAAGPMQHSLADDHPKSYFMKNMDNFVSTVKEKGSDILLLQEVDLDSKRSWYLNQLEYLMKELGWGYAAPVVDWDFYFPLRKERKIVKATVVISKFPIISNQYTLTSGKPNFSSKLLNIFYYPLLWKSTMQRVSIDIQGRPLDIYNVHLCVWNRDARAAQADFLAEWIRQSSDGRDYLIGGDFNFQAYIRGTPIPEEDMQRPPFLNILWDNLDGLSELMITKNDSIETIHEDFTFPERKHRYDFIFYSNKLKLLDSEVIDSLDSSDHLPVSGTFDMKL